MTAILDEAERLDAEALRALQERRWGELRERLTSHPLFGARLSAARGSLSSLHSVPFTTKPDLWDNYPFGLLAVDRSQLRRVHGTSGTKGRPTLAAYTATDLQLFRRVNARALAAAGAGPGTVVHNAYGYGLFTGGLGLHGGAEELGCCVVPISGGQTARQVVLVTDLRPEVLCCTPSYAVLLGEALVSAGVSAPDNPLRVGIFGAEPWSEELRARIEAVHGITALDIYGMCEVIGPGVAFECPQSRAEIAGGRRGGLHVNEDHFFIEVIDPLSGDPVEDGTPGEVVFTTLTKQAMPVVRYRTGDLASLNRSPCVCGRTTVRMSRLVGRSDDMLVVRGVNVFPSEIESALLEMPVLAPHYTIVLDSRGPMPEMVVACELAAGGGSPGGAPRVTDGGGADDVGFDARRRMAAVLRHALDRRLGVRGRVLVGLPGTIPRTEVGKAVRLVRLTGTPDAASPGLAPSLVALFEEWSTEAGGER